jgi:hypothetical protein
MMPAVERHQAGEHKRLRKSRSLAEAERGTTPDDLAR